MRAAVCQEQTLTNVTYNNLITHARIFGVCDALHISLISCMCVCVCVYICFAEPELTASKNASCVFARIHFSHRRDRMAHTHAQHIGCVYCWNYWFIDYAISEAQGIRRKYRWGMRAIEAFAIAERQTTESPRTDARS